MIQIDERKGLMARWIGRWEESNGRSFRFDDQGIEKSRIPIALPYFDFGLEHIIDITYHATDTSYTSIYLDIPKRHIFSSSATLRVHTRLIREQANDHTQWLDAHRTSREVYRLECSYKARTRCRSTLLLFPIGDIIAQHSQSLPVSYPGDLSRKGLAMG
jgi:hypothetical protein